jgi:alcohol dehydrogenase
LVSEFTFHLPTKIVFKQPALDALRAELAVLSIERVLLVSDPGLAHLGLVSRFRDGLSEQGFVTTAFTEVSSNPTTTEVSIGLTLADDAKIQAVVALGGGSVIDVAKAIAMLAANGGAYADYQWAGKAITKRSWPLFAVPTTAGTGSEISKVAVILDLDNPFKKGVRSPLMFPHVAILDPALTRSLPPKLTAATGMDAFTHALEAYVGRQANPFTDQLALAALRTVWIALPRAVANGDDIEARERLMLAALRGGIAMDQAGLGLIHALSGPLTSHLHLHHGLANAVIMPYVLSFTLPAVPPERRRKLNDAIGLACDADGDDLVERLTQFVENLGLPTRLSDLDVPLDAVDWGVVADETTQMVLIGNNPRPASVTDCRAILDQMITG